MYNMIHHCSLQWVQLQQRKSNLKHLFEKMQDWQFEKVREEPDKVLTEDNRALQEEDIQRYTCVVCVYTVVLYMYCTNILHVQYSTVCVLYVCYCILV